MNNFPNLIKFYNRPQKLQTLTNSDLYSICIKWKLKFNGIYMKEGNYIINLQNSYENGSHWTCLLKIKIIYIIMIRLL